MTILEEYSTSQKTSTTASRKQNNISEDTNRNRSEISRPSAFEIIVNTQNRNSINLDESLIRALSTSTSSAMISAVGDRYITPEYLAPLPSSSEKTGKSPLQLLAQTCSQIGADQGSNKLLAEKSGSSSANLNSKDSILSNRGSTSPNSKGVNNNNSAAERGSPGSSSSFNAKGSTSPALIVSDQPTRHTTTSPTTIQKDKVNFKPYEIDDLKSITTLNTTKSHNGSKPSSVVSLSPTTSPKNSNRPPSGSNHIATSSNRSPPSSTASVTSASETTPVIRSGMEVLSGHPKDIPLGTYRIPGMDNPAFRPMFGMPGYGQSSMAANLAAAAANAAGGGMSVCRDPYCRDPTCPTALYNAQLASMCGPESGISSGYLELFKAHQMALAMAAATGSNGSSGGSASTPSSASSGVGPYICNWMNGREGYCGKRHASAEELLQHLRTHTNLSTNDSTAASLLSPTLYPPPSNSLLSGNSASAAAVAAAGLHRTYGGAAALAASRFHPYAKHGGIGGPTGLSSALASLSGGLRLPPPPTPPGLSASLAGLAAGAYSPSSLYALYGSRLAGSSMLP